MQKSMSLKYEPSSEQDAKYKRIPFVMESSTDLPNHKEALGGLPLTLKPRVE